GLVYRVSDPKVVILLFGSGKLVITGGKKPEDMVSAVDRIVTELKSLSFLR
ncbi:MAG: TATA-box-binding protein, partial [Halobacteriota archaeon]